MFLCLLTLSSFLLLLLLLLLSSTTRVGVPFRHSFTRWQLIRRAECRPPPLFVVVEEEVVVLVVLVVVMVVVMVRLIYGGDRGAGVLCYACGLN